VLEWQIQEDYLVDLQRLALDRQVQETVEVQQLVLDQLMQETVEHKLLESGWPKHHLVALGWELAWQWLHHLEI
jgi:hypothetical protein